MLRKVVQTGVTIGTGVALDRMSQTRPQAPANQPPKPLRTGSAILDGISQRTKLPEDAPNPLAQGVQSQAQHRVDLASKLQQIARNPELAAQNATHMFEDVKKDVQVLHGAGKIAQDGLTPSDGVRLAKAGAQSAENSIAAMARGAFAGVTTSPGSIEKLSETVQERAKHEAASIGAGFAASQALATAVGMIPHPVAKGASVAIRMTGQAAAGSNASEALRKMNTDLSGPVREEIVSIAREKSQGGNPPKSDSV